VLLPLAAVSADTLMARFSPLLDNGLAGMQAEGVPPARVSLELSMDMRYNWPVV